MTVTLTISELPWSVNAMYLNSAGGRGKGRIKAPGYRQWREAMGWEIRAQRPPAFDQRVSVSITLPQATRGDADNRCKAVLDLLQEAGVVTNDKLCDPVSIGRGDVFQTTIKIEVV
jgi:Holliday junction resolvase RusA-like endonuclease